MRLKDCYEKYIDYIRHLSDKEWEQITEQAEAHSKDEEEEECV